MVPYFAWTGYRGGHVMLGFLKNLLGNENEREIKKIMRTVEQINELEDEVKRLTDRQLYEKTPYFRNLLANGRTLDDILPEAYAVVREASRRTLGMRHFDVQLLGGIVLHQGKIAEMKTGEGKTLVATLPAYLNALSGNGVHIVTVNDYLASRDREWMGRIYRFLGLSVGLIVHGLDYDEKKTAYQSDITYGTNNEYGFDYLRDNMALHKDNQVQRELSYAIVDEVDSILVDEARTPLIISGAGEKSTDLYYRFAQIAPRLKDEIDYNVDEKANTVAPTEEGIGKVERMLGVPNLYEHENMDLSHYLNQALRAYALMKCDRDYIVKDGQVIIVDEFTGRLMYGRRYSNGLHQAIEAKEGVKIEKESQTLATITFQNYFRMYRKLAGMTGTAETEAEEFRKIYKLDVIVIPTNEPMIRSDLPDVIYKNEKAKFKAVVDEIAERHQVGQPMLVGTISIEKSEHLSGLLSKKGIPHQVLNAKYHEREAEIVAQAGRLGAVTIATNMAGRGTDIVLGGNADFMAAQEIRRRETKDASDIPDAGEVEREALRKELVAEYRKQTEADGKSVIENGGLHIIGTERHESRRIDNQLRGRAGRQGDPGSSRFYISLEDDLMRLFGGDNIAVVMEKLGIEEDQPIEHGIITRAIENAQRRVESRNFEARKHVLEYDDVMNQQREVIYQQRRQILEGTNLKDQIWDMIAGCIQRGLDIFADPKIYPEEWDLAGLIEYLEGIYMPPKVMIQSELERYTREELQQLIYDRSLELYDYKEKDLGSDTMRELERVVMLRVVDSKWIDHLDGMDDLREGIGLRAYGQRDPLTEYKFEAYDAFQQMIESIQGDIVRNIFHVNIVKQPKERKFVDNRNDAGTVQPIVKKDKKVGRNDPCPCGSGKKYKKCCGKEG
jgi:preprotein translocase subunit SecA